MTSAQSHDAYLDARPPDQRTMLADLRALIRSLLPGAEEVISYAMPGFRLQGKVIAGYAGFARNCGYYPHSGRIVPQFATELAAAGFRFTPGAIQFTPARPLPADLVARLVRARLDEVLAA
jgi:uncharacterized protein YdhG (YjbR/CyaY superfamily)